MKYHPLDLIRGLDAQGRNVPYRASEWVRYKHMLGTNENPGQQARQANERAFYDASLVIGHATMKDALMESLTISDIYLLTETGEITLNGVAYFSARSLHQGLPSDRVRELEDVCMAIGLGAPAWYLYGNPPVLTAFFPSVRVPDTLVDIVEVGRRAVWRVEEGDSFLQSPGLTIQRAAFMLEEYAGIDIPKWVPFSWEAVKSATHSEPDSSNDHELIRATSARR